jgi:dienelactone hydrolase
VSLIDLPRPRRNYSPWFYWVTKLMATSRDDPFDPADPDGFGAWRDRCRARLAALLGPRPEPVPLDLETLDSTPCDGYRRDLVVYDTEDVMSVPAFLLVPDDRRDPGPAVLAVHGHGPGKSLVCGLERTEAPNGDYAVQLVRQGFVVLAPDLRCFGERLDWNPEDHYACDTNLVHAVMAGLSPLAQNLWDLARSLDVLEQHELVDPARIGVAGLSLGGTMSLFLAATDERVAATVVSGYLSSWGEAHKVPWNMCGSQVMPGMLGRLEHVDLGALVAPRPLLVETGTEDLIFPLAAARESMAQLRTLYESMGAADRLVHDVFEGDHQWHGVEALPFLRRWLA